MPVSSVLVVSETAIDSKKGDQWTRRDTYVTGVCKALDSRQHNHNSGLMEGPFVTGDKWDQPPLNPDEIYLLDPKSPKVDEFLNKFEEWFRQNETKLREKAAKEAPEIEGVRKKMIALEP